MRLLRRLALLAVALLPAMPALAADIEVFVHEGCPHCEQAQVFLKRLQQERPALDIVIRDVGKEPAAMQRLQQLAVQHGAAAGRVPAFLIGEQLLVGYSAQAGSDRLIRELLAQGAPPAAESASCGIEQPVCGEEAPRDFTIDLFGRTLSLDEVGLPLFTLAMGLLDGFNPCSMWVLILMISLLAPLNDRPRMFAVAGTFIAVQGAAYFLFLAAWLNLFLFIGLSRASEVVIAALALFAGALNLKDFAAFGRGPSLSIPASARPGIYQRMRRILQARNLGGALIATVLLGVLVQIVELMCTSGFPALYTRILTERALHGADYYGHLLLYDLAYMLDDLLILALGIVTLSQRRLQEQEGRWLKLLSGMVMVGLGIYLLLP
jgi:glutaredoxin